MLNFLKSRRLRKDIAMNKEKNHVMTAAFILAALGLMAVIFIRWGQRGEER